MLTKQFKKLISAILKVLFCLVLFLACTTHSLAAAPAGYSEYYIPGDEGNMYTAFTTLDDYNPGTVRATNGSTAVVGTGTTFTTTFVAGQTITIAGVPYIIQSITDNTHLTLQSNYTGATASLLTYLTPMHSIITVTAWSDNTTIYYDHWEGGYQFDPSNPDANLTPGGHVEKYVLNRGQSITFESGAIGLPRTVDTPPTTICNNYRNRTLVSSGVTTCYDGGDHIYVAGGVVTVTRGSYIEGVGIGTQATAWEIYPVKPQLTTYVLPFGENQGFWDFNRVFVLVQATEDNTTVTVDLNGDGVPDILNLNRDATWNNAGDGTTVTLNKGQTFLLDSTSACPSHANCTTAGTNQLPAGAVIQGNETLQVKYIAGQPNQNSVARGFSAFPRGYWTKDYYAPLDQPATVAANTDYFLYNPNASPITVTWESSTNTGSFSIPAGSTVSYRALVPAGVPVNSGLYFKGSDVFWGVGVGDAGNHLYEWGFSLLPSTMLFNEHFLGWAPDDNNTAANAAPAAPVAGRTDMGMFLTVAQDNTTVFVDVNNDGIVDQTYPLGRLQTQYITDPDGDLSQAHIWATGPFTMAYGQNADNANTPGPPGGIDLGYVAIPGSDFVSLVLTVDKTVSPQVVPTASGSVATFTIKVDSQKYTLDGGANGVTVTDFLPPNWQYVNNSATITWPDMTTHAATNPSVTGLPATGQTLSWTSAQLGTNGSPGMNLNQEVMITFQAQTTAVLAAGTMSQNRVQAVGKRTFGFPSQTQTFTTTDFAYVTSGAVTITKTSSAADPVSPGDTFTYTTTVSNPSAAGTNLLTGISLYDALPAGVTNVTGTTTLNRSTVADSFNSQAYNLNAGTRNWAGNWVEANDGTNVANGGDIQILNGELRLDNSASNEPTISRAVNLTGATSALLSFRYRTDTGVDAADHILVQAGTAGTAGACATLTGGDITGITGASSGTLSFDISAYIGANTTIRFTFPNNSYTRANEFFYVDDLSITYNIAFAGPNPPDLISASYLYALVGGQSITTTFNVTVNDPFPTGQMSITNTASTTSVQMPIPVTASVTNTVLVPSSLSASAGGRVWLDANGDGVQDIGLEPGIPNIEVTLKDRFGTPVATTLTDGTGRYLFDGVTSGTGYYVEVTNGLSAGLSQTFPIPPGLNRTTSFNLVDGQVYTSADLGYRAAAGTASFGDLVWVDANADGIRNAGEIGLDGATIKLYRDLNGNGVLDSLTDLPTGSGTVAATNGSVAVVGTGTAFAAVNAGDAIKINGVAYTVLGVTDPTHLTLTTNYAGVTASGLTYAMPMATVSASDGTYLLTGVTATGSETYFVSATTPSGYTPTGAESYRYLSVAAGSTLLNADFGFNSTGTTYSIKDRVWTDTNGNAVFDGGENGIAGVTIELLGASLNVIATTTTASDGTFTFSGLPGGGADYTVRINDSAGVLLDYYGTTSYSLALKRAESNLVASIDRVATPPPSYGFRPLRSIGDTIFNDLGGTNGVQDAGEPGIPGVVVSLYRNNAPLGTFNGSDTLLSTVTTDANGQYLFSGLADGEYIVSVPVPAGYSFIANGAVNPDLDGNPANGIQNRATMVGGVNVLNKDFGFRANTSRTVSGTVWYDLDADGVIDAGESRLAGVTLEVRRNCPSPCTLVATVTTDASGAYSVPGLVNDNSYTVRVTDINAVLIDYAPTFEYDTGTAGPFDNEAVVNLTSGNVANANFGFYKLSAPTRVTLSDFRAYQQSGQVYVRWETASEHNTLGFNLLRLDPATGEYKAVNSGLMPSIFKHHHGGIYTVRDGGAFPGGTYTYKLIEVEKTGAQLFYGPFTVSVGSSSGDETVMSGSSHYDRRDKGDAEHQEARMKTRSAALTATRLAMKAASGDRIKIFISESGIYYVDARDISSLLGLSRANVTTMISRGQLSLSSQGKQASYLPAANNAGLYFYGADIDSIYAKENVYWLEKGKGTIMKVLHGAGPKPSPEKQSFTETLHLEQNLSPWEQLFNDPAADYWFWAQLFASSFYTDPPMDFTFEAPGLSESQNTATIQLHLFGGSDAGVPNDHHVKVSLNGDQMADEWWSGLNQYTITFTAPITTGENTLTVESIADLGVSANSVFINSFDVTYQRLYEASGDRLAFRGDGHMPVTVEGFTSPDIMVFDITEPLMPKLNSATTVKSNTNGYTVSLNPAAASTPYFSVTGSVIQRLSGKAVDASSLSSRSNAADYIIIAPAGLIPTAQVLADYRKAQGYKTMIVDIEDIMNEFNYGIPSPEAIKDFLSYAYSNWRKAPRYVLLAGDGSMDYKDNLGYGGNLIPSRMVPTPNGLFVSDNSLADVNGNHVPEIAIGRLPVITPDDLLTVINKIKTYERAPANKKVVLLADTPDTEAGDFISRSEALAGVFPAGYTLTRIYLYNDNPATVNTARSALFTAINNGSAFFNYVGHAGPNQLSNLGLINHYPEFAIDDLPLFTNAGVLPVMTAMTCLVGNFSDPYQIILTEALLLKAGGGVAATWAPTGLSDDAEAAILNREFYNAFFISGVKPAIGDVVRKALAAYKSEGTMPFMMDIYNILGDPALRIR